MQQTNAMQKLGKRIEWQAIEDLTKPLDELSDGLTNEDLHLWRIPMKLDAKQSALALDLLNDRQLEKYGRRKDRESKQAYLAGRYYLFLLISQYEKLPLTEIELSYSRLNKPSLSNNPNNLQFNYTDTRIGQHSVGLFAFCKNAEVGVDLEARTRQSQFSQIAARRFSVAELEYVTNEVTSKRKNETPESQPMVDPERCLAIWTRKEAYGKAIGKGINFTMNERDLAPGVDPYELNFTDDEEKLWRLNQIEIGDDLIACVVHAGHQTLNLKGFKRN